MHMSYRSEFFSTYTYLSRSTRLYAGSSKQKNAHLNKRQKLDHIKNYYVIIPQKIKQPLRMSYTFYTDKGRKTRRPMTIPLVLSSSSFVFVVFIVFTPKPISFLGHTHTQCCRILAMTILRQQGIYACVLGRLCVCVRKIICKRRKATQHIFQMDTIQWVYKGCDDDSARYVAL